MAVYTRTIDAGTVDMPSTGAPLDGGEPDSIYTQGLDGGGPFTVTEPPPARRVTSPRWTFVLALPDGTQVAAPTAARSRKVSVRLADSSECSFSIDGRDPQAAEITELATDVLAYRGSELLLRCRVGNTRDSLGADSHDVSVTAADYRAVLGRRIMYADRTFGQVDAEQIGWDLIAATQAESGGDLGITRGSGQSTGVGRDRTYEAGKAVGEAVQQLSELADGFDWTIDENLVYRVWYPARGSDSAMVLDYGGTVASVDRTVDTAGFANAHRVSGDDSLSAQVREAATFGPAGRWDKQDGFTDVSEASTLAAKADWLQGEESTLRPAYTVTLRPGAWTDPGDLWVGDYALLVVQSGRLDVVEALRVYELGFAVGESGEETVTVTLGRTDPLAPGRREREVQRRLRQLERR